MKLKYIIIHCSGGEWGCSRAIRQWHIEKGWRDIGYHFVIQNGFPTYEDFAHSTKFSSLDGQIECGRYLNSSSFIDDNEIGAHALGYNRNSVGICLIGNHKFSDNQLESCSKLCVNLMKKFGIKLNNIFGHYETEMGAKQKKTCPNLDMNDLRSRILIM